jgi:hypothetical protein
MHQTSGYWNALLLCRESGYPVDTRVGMAREWLNLTFDVHPATLPRRRNMRRELGYMELCQLLTGAYSEQEIARVAPRVDMSLFGRSAVYGPRIINAGVIRKYSFRDQLAEVIAELCRFPNSRRATISIINSHEPLEDQPCLSMLQFQVRKSFISTTAYFRSWDLWFGAPHDLIVVSGLSQVIASCVVGTPLAVNPITVIAGNAHIYERSLDAITGPVVSWSFLLPNLGSLARFRSWASEARHNLDWKSGAIPGLETENFPPVPKIETA